MNLNLRGKLLLAQIPLGLALALVGVVAVSSVRALGISSDQILKENYRSVLAAQRMKESLERIDSAAIFFASGRKELCLNRPKPTSSGSRPSCMSKRETSPKKANKKRFTGCARCGTTIDIS